MRYPSNPPFQDAGRGEGKEGDRTGERCGEGREWERLSKEEQRVLTFASAASAVHGVVEPSDKRMLMERVSALGHERWLQLTQLARRAGREGRGVCRALEDCVSAFGKVYAVPEKGETRQLRVGTAVVRGEKCWAAV